MSTKTKFPMGLQDLFFCPITAAGSASALPTYSAAVSLGHAVHAALTVNSASVPIFGDNAQQLKIDSFISGTFNTETLMSELELEQKLYGGTYSAEGGLTRTLDDAGTPGGVCYIRNLMKKDKSMVYRAGVLFYCAADRAASGWDGDTKKESVEAKNATVNFDVMTVETGAWIWEQDYTTRAAALEGIKDKLSLTAAPA